MSLIKKSLFISLIVLVAACKKDEVEEKETVNCGYEDPFVTVNDPNFSENGMIPIHLQNYWKYTDSTWSASGDLVSSSEYTMTPTNIRTKHGDYWWEIGYPLVSIHQSGDTIYRHESVWPTGCSAKTPIYYLFPEDSIASTLVMEGDIAIPFEARKVASFVTPNETFADCFVFDKLGMDRTVIKPGVGILEYEWYNSWSSESRKITLIEYHLE